MSPPVDVEVIEPGSSLFRVRPRAHAEIPVRGTDTQIIEESLGHDGVVVLARMNEHVFPPPARIGRAEHGGDLHEVWTGTYYMEKRQRVDR